ncbi:MAG: ATP-binding cassette domain-containing protein [Candidatus Izemoplasmataceae bacterium]
MALFEFNQVHFKTILSIDHIQIKTHEITAIIGKSGAGKTTFLHLLNKMLSPTEGTILFKEKSLSEIDTVSHRKKVPLLSQKPFLFASTIYDNFKRVASIHQIPLSNEKIEHLLEQVNIDKPLDHRVKPLSSGEAQRIAIARIMYIDADVILLDEPSSALDDLTEEAVIKYIVDYVKKSNKSLIMVTHSKTIAKKYADRVLEIKDKAIKEVNYD